MAIIIVIFKKLSCKAINRSFLFWWQSQCSLGKINTFQNWPCVCMPLSILSQFCRDKEKNKTGLKGRWEQVSWQVSQSAQNTKLPTTHPSDYLLATCSSYYYFLANSTTWVWVEFSSWWWTGRPGVLQSMGSQTVGHNWGIGLNWTENQ